MKTRMLLIAAVAVLVAAAPALAFHDHGVAACNGCHTMHNSERNLPMNYSADGLGTGTAVGHGYDYLLLFPNATDTCLRCHGNNTASYNVFESDLTMSNLADYYSAGNFAFLLEDNINDGRGGSTSPILGQESGHNLRSGIKGSNWDTVLLTPPGNTGNLPTNKIECTSCHDPHGTSSFRLLYQNGQSVDVDGNTITFGASVDAVGISYSSIETNSNHNAYISGYSAWCATCHGDFHNGAGNLIHPSGTNLTATVVAKYNAYKGIADCAANPPSGGNPCGSGTSADSYLHDVPFEDAGMTTTTITGPTTSSTVACMSCHRAHATSARDAGRWDFQVTFLDTDGVQSGSFKIPYASTNLPADAEQRSLCNKCHSQDEYDEYVP